MGLLMRKSPWYQAGLAFGCMQCGRCCSGPEEGYVWAGKDEIATIAKHLEMTTPQMREQYVRRVGRRESLVEQNVSNDCIFLIPDDQGQKTCRIYPVRPRQCRTWPFWPSNLSSPVDWADAQRRCGGINRGIVHSCDDIEAKRKATSE